MLPFIKQTNLYTMEECSDDSDIEEEELLSTEITTAITSTPHCAQHETQVHGSKRRLLPSLHKIGSSSSSSESKNDDIPLKVAQMKNRRNFLQKSKSVLSLKELDRRISLRLKNKTRNRKLLQGKADSCSTVATAASSVVSEASCYESTSKRVTFSTAEYREYRITIADSNNKLLYPITLDWQYSDDLKVVQLDDEDDIECSDKKHGGRRKYLVPLSIEQRQQRLLASGMSRRELVALERRRHIESTGEWAFRNKSNSNSSKCRPTFASDSLLRYFS